MVNCSETAPFYEARLRPDGPPEYKVAFLVAVEADATALAKVKFNSHCKSVKFSFGLFHCQAGHEARRARLFYPDS